MDVGEMWKKPSSSLLSRSTLYSAPMSIMAPVWNARWMSSSSLTLPPAEYSNALSRHPSMVSASPSPMALKKSPIRSVPGGDRTLDISEAKMLLFSRFGTFAHVRCWSSLNPSR